MKIIIALAALSCIHLGGCGAEPLAPGEDRPEAVTGSHIAKKDPSQAGVQVVKPSLRDMAGGVPAPPPPSGR
jgi:hypothetical protein